MTVAAVNGGWTSWAVWTAWAPVGCNTAQSRTHSRSCTNPAPSCAGSDCVGVTQEAPAKARAYTYDQSVANCFPVLSNCCANFWANAAGKTCDACTVCAAGLTMIASCATSADTVCRGM